MPFPGGGGKAMFSFVNSLKAARKSNLLASSSSVLGGCLSNRRRQSFFPFTFAMTPYHPVGTIGCVQHDRTIWHSLLVESDDTIPTNHERFSMCLGKLSWQGNGSMDGSWPSMVVVTRGPKFSFSFHSKSLAWTREVSCIF